MKRKTTKPPSIFDGDDALARITAILHDGRVLRDLPGEVAGDLARTDHLVVLEPNETLFREDDVGDDVCFILTGKVGVQVNGQLVAERGPGEIIGEMAMLEPSPKRSASIVAREASCLLRVPFTDFTRVSAAYPALWKGIARELAERLRQRNRFVPCANGHPVFFLGSSVERLAVVDKLVEALQHNANLHPWSTAFSPSNYTLDDLMTQAHQSDFAAFVFAPDDKVTARRKMNPAVRDNVIYEAGLFTGVLGRARVLLVRPRGEKVNIPSDLLGLKTLEYTMDSGEPNVSAVCSEIRGVLKTHGCRSIESDRR